MKNIFIVLTSVFFLSCSDVKLDRKEIINSDNQTNIEYCSFNPFKLVATKCSENSSLYKISV